MGLQKGIVDSERSSLFFEIMRLVDECPSIQYVFLENVSNITKCGMQEVVFELTRRGFNMQWTTKSAGSLGAPHVRNRWFCLASRASNHQKLSELLNNFTSKMPNHINHWQNELHARVSFKPSIKMDDTYDELWIQRCQSLGNTVVPIVVRSAFMALARGCVNWHSMFEGLEPFAADAEKLAYPFPDSGFIYTGKYIAIPKSDAEQRHDVQINLIHDGKPLQMINYPTPRRGITHASTLTDRSLRDLPTILVNCKESKDYITSQGVEPPEKMHTIVIANVNYIEWMMGYPKDWTKSHKFKKRVAKTVVVEDDADEQSIQTPSSPAIVSIRTEPRPKRYNGMHMLMKDMPGKDIKEVAAAWRALSQERKDVYTKQALSFQA